MIRTLPLVLVLALGAPAPASADEPYGTLTLIQVRRAGFLEEVARGGDEVSVERGGEVLAAERDMAVYEGDVLVTDRGACVVTTPAGWTVTVGEGSRLEVHTTWTQRLGTAIYRVRGAFGVRVERIEVLVEGTVFRVTWDGAAGEVAVTEGAVRVRGDAGEEALVNAGERVKFTASAPAAVEPLDDAAAQALADQQEQLGSPNGGLPSRSERVRLGLGGGVAVTQGTVWGSARLRARVRAVGPLWISAAGGIVARSVDSDAGSTAIAIPIAVGLHGVGDLPGGAYAVLGGSFDLVVGDRCTEPIACERASSAQAGGTLDVGLGLPLGCWMSLSLEARIGAGVRQEYGESFQARPATVVDPRLGLTAWLEVRL